MATVRAKPPAHGSGAEGREIVVRVRRRGDRAPWRLGAVVRWATVGVLGDPGAILAPFLLVVAFVIAVLATGAPGRPEVLVPLVSLPPTDAFIDDGTIELLDRSQATLWLLRLVFAAARSLAFGLIAAVALQRARGEPSDLRAAWSAVRRRVRTLFGLAAISSGLALLLLERASLDAAGEAGTTGTGLLVGTLFLPGAVVACLAEDLGLGGALRRGAAWVRTRPIGHIVLVIGSVSAAGGLLRLATFGEPVGAPALPVTLYAFATALATVVSATAIARRHVLLYSNEARAAAPRLRRVRHALAAGLRRWRALGAESRAARREVQDAAREERRARHAERVRRAKAVQTRVGEAPRVVEPQPAPGRSASARPARRPTPAHRRRTARGGVPRSRSRR